MSKRLAVAKAEGARVESYFTDLPLGRRRGGTLVQCYLQSNLCHLLKSLSPFTLLQYVTMQRHRANVAMPCQSMSQRLIFQALLRLLLPLQDPAYGAQSRQAQ